MNGARIGIAGQSMGVAEAAYRIARDYASSRKQFGVAIEKLPAVRDMLIDMKIQIEAGRALLYETSRIVDFAISYEKQLENDPPEDKVKLKELKNLARKYKRLAGLVTPMSKYYCSEMCNRVTYDSIQVLGGSGYMRDYACERLARDARITTIYEGTSQLQVVAAIRGVCSGTAEKLIEDLAKEKIDDDMKDLVSMLEECKELMNECVVFVKDKSNDYMDLFGRPLVDIAMDIIMGYLFCSQGSTQVEMGVPVASDNSQSEDGTISMKQRKKMIARRFITRNYVKAKQFAEVIKSGDTSTFEQYEELIGPVPVVE
jgi:hypothetical protein